MLNVVKIWNLTYKKTSQKSDKIDVMQSELVPTCSSLLVSFMNVMRWAANGTPYGWPVVVDMVGTTFLHMCSV